MHTGAGPPWLGTAATIPLAMLLSALCSSPEAIPAADCEAEAESKLVAEVAVCSQVASEVTVMVAVLETEPVVFTAVVV